MTTDTSQAKRPRLDEHEHVYNASEFSKRSFWPWVDGVVFTPIAEVNVKIIQGEGSSPFRPTSSCAECATIWKQSGLEEVVKRVKWDQLGHRDDIEPLDPRVRSLGCSLRGAQLYGFTNGLSKSLVWRIVDIVTQHGLCTKHQIRIHVTCPGSSTDVGGVKLTVSVKKRVVQMPGDDSSGSEGEYAIAEVVSLRGFPDLAVLADVSPSMVLLIAENKKSAKAPTLREGQEEKETYMYDAQLGQALFYLVAIQLRAFTIHSFPPPSDGYLHGRGQFLLRGCQSRPTGSEDSRKHNHHAEPAGWGTVLCPGTHSGHIVPGP